MEIPRRTRLQILLADPALSAVLTAHHRALDDLASASVGELVTRPKAVATAVVRGVELVIPLDGVVDISAEVQRLDKVLGRVDKDVSQLERRLSNKNFVDRAPDEVVAEVREKLAAAVGRRDTLRASRERLAEAL